MMYNKKQFCIAIVVIVTVIIVDIIAFGVTALSNKGPTRPSLSERVALSQGEASLLGSSTTFFNSQPLWSGKKNAEKHSLQLKNKDQSKSFTPRTASNQSSFTPKKGS